MKVVHKMVVGSNLWGTNHARSDVDMLAIVEPNYSKILLGKKDEPSSSQYDFVWTTAKFHNLIVKGNPNALQYLMHNDQCLDVDYGKYLSPMANIISDNQNNEIITYNLRVGLNNTSRLNKEWGWHIEMFQPKELLQMLHLIQQVEYILKHDTLCIIPLKLSILNNNYRMTNDYLKAMDLLHTRKHDEIIRFPDNYYGDKIKEVFELFNVKFIKEKEFGKFNNVTISMMDELYLNWADKNFKEYVL